MPTKKKAKKNAVKKKAAKKKVAKKKSATTKKTTYKAPSLTVASKTLHISFGCDGGFCVADKTPLHMNPLDKVVMTAPTSDIRVTFRGGSPFASGKNPINIPRGTSAPPETVIFVSGRPKKFSYRLRCRNVDCPTPTDDPSMIID